MNSNWLAPQHAPDTRAPDLEEGTPDDLLAETIESVIWHQFRTASRGQVAAVTAQIRRAAVKYAEAWVNSTPRRQVPPWT